MLNHELIWGLPAISYYFLAGLGAGALITSTSLLLRGGPEQTYFRFARFGAFLAVPVVALGTGMLVMELGSFETGHWFRFINLYKVMTLSPMSVGSWLLLVYMVVATPYSLLFLVKGAHPDDKYQGLRQKLAWVCVPLGIGVAVYTGVLLGAMPSRPLWNSPIIAMLFLLSAISCGIAAVLLIDWVAGLYDSKTASTTYLKERAESGYLLATTVTLLIGLQILVIFLFFMYAHLSVGDKRMAIRVFEIGGELSSLFWWGLVVVGLVIPGLIELVRVMPRLLYKRSYEHSGMAVFIVPVLIIVGGFLLRYVIVVGGQISRLAGL